MAETKVSEKLPKVSLPLFSLSSPFNTFRYALAFLFIVLKLHAFGAPTEVVAWPWWLVLSPAYVLELSIFSVCVLIGAVGVIAFVLYALYLATKLTINSLKRSRRTAPAPFPGYSPTAGQPEPRRRRKTVKPDPMFGTHLRELLDTLKKKSPDQ